MRTRITTLGTVLAVFGLLFMIGGGIAYAQVQDGYDSLQAFSTEQNVTLSYNDDGELIDRGSTEEAQNIMTLLTVDWAYPVDDSDFNPDDPLVNSDSEYMYQMATIVYHTSHGEFTGTVDEVVEYNGETFEPGVEYTVDLGGRYWTEFDRMHPIDGQARAAAWSGTVHGLVGELGVGTVTHSALQMGLGIAAILGGLGGTLLVAGLGLVWAARGQDERLAPGVGTETRESVTV